MKQCSKCKEVKELSEFYKRPKGSRDGYNGRCKVCVREDKRVYMSKGDHRKRQSDAHRRWRESEPNMWRNRTQQWRETNPEAALVSSAKMRAKKHGIEFSITVSDVVIPEYCPILGIKMERAVYGTRAGTYRSPSLDRIDNSKGYIPGNVQVISRRANAMKSDSSLEEMILLGDWAKRQLG